MSLDPKYVIAPNLEQYYVDKTTGLPLAGGTVEFFSDINRSQHKSIYKLSGSPPNYSYTQLPNPSTLSGVGTFQDAGGNNIIPYYYPYDVDGNVELYYIVVKDSDGVVQFTREGWPNTIADTPSSATSQAFNFISNGQFLLHNDLPADILNNIPAGQVRDPLTLLAQDGWIFSRPGTSTATDKVTFPKYSTYVANPTASPRYSVQIECLGADPSDAFKDLRWRRGDVNKFSSDTQQYTFAFNGVTVNSGPFTVSLLLAKNYGTGGSPSPSTRTLLTTFNITSSQQLFQYSFVFGANTGKQVGTNNDDYFELILSFPTNIGFGGKFTDFMLETGAVTITQFPQQLNSDMIVKSLSPPPPNPDGSDLFLPIIINQEGASYDHSLIGKVFPSVSETPDVGELLADGTTYFSNGYSSDGVPYRRLQTKLWNSTVMAPRFGTGTFVSATYSSANNMFMMLNNVAGFQTHAADGASPTGFTFNTLIDGHAGYGYRGAVYSDTFNYVWIINTAAGVCSAISSGTSGLSVTASVNQTNGSRLATGANTVQIVSVNNIVSIPAGGSYFNIATPSAQNYVWFQVNGVGADPLQPGTGIKVNNLGSFLGEDVAFNIKAAVSGQQMTQVTMTSGATIPGGSYWTFYANSQLYYVWYNLNGLSTDPNVLNGIGIPVFYQTSYTLAQIYNATTAAINDTYYAVPDLRSYYIKGWANGVPGQDLNIGYRYSNDRFLTGNNLGTIEFDMLMSHTHQVTSYSNVAPVTKQIVIDNATGSPTAVSQPLDNAGVSQNDVKNIYLNYIIKY